jgi:hypothetical protein
MPVNPKEWAEGLDPWKPVFLSAPLARGGKIVTDWKPGDARSIPTGGVNGRAASADDKAGIFSIHQRLRGVGGDRRPANREREVRLRGRGGDGLDRTSAS